MISVDAVSKLAAYAIYESVEDIDCQWLHMEWTLDHFVALMVADHFKDAMASQQKLALLGERFVYNDLDCTAFSVDWGKDWCAFAHESQQNNYVYVLKEDDVSELAKLRGMLEDYNEKQKMRIYRYWKMKTEDYEDWPDSDFSDCPDGEYGYGPERPTLEWLIEHDGTKYNDCRDDAFIVRTADITGKSDHTSWNYPEIKSALFNIRPLWDEFRETPE